MANTQGSFQRLHAGGFSALLPIIPHDAPISPQSKALQGREAMLGKIPGRRLADGWCGFAGWERYEASEDDLAEWEADGAGVGLRCTGVVAVDIDVVRADLVRLVRLEAIEHLGFAPARTGNAPKVLLLFRVEEDLPTKRRLSFRDWTGQQHAIELLGARQQFVVQGVHPTTGQPYRWDEDPAEVGRAGLPGVTLEDLEAFLDGCRSVLEALDCEDLAVTQGHGQDERASARLRAGDLDLLEETVRAIPNTEDTPRETMVAMAHAIKAACDDDPHRGRDIFAEWCRRYPAGQQDGEVDHVYWSAHVGSTGAPWLFDQARAAGVDTAAADFGPVEAANDDAGPLVVTDSDLDTGTIWDDYVYINKTKRFRNLKNGMELDKEQMRDKFRTADSKKSAADEFLEHRRPHSFADETWYAPGSQWRVWREPKKNGKTLANTWRPGPAHSGQWDRGRVDDEGVRLWLRLVEQIAPDEAQREHLMDWFAHLIQRPGVKPSHHPLIGSTHHGLGKDSALAPLVQGLAHNARTIQATDLESEWSWWAEDVQLVVVAELHSFERRAVMNKMKNLMAAPPETITINRKGVAQYDVPNLFGMVLFTNNADAAALEQGDRRFFVIWSALPPLEQAFYVQYHQWLAAGGAADVISWLKQRDIRRFDAKARAPDTEAKEAMRQAALGQVDGLLVAGIEDEQGPFARDLVTMNEVQAWLKTQVRAMPGPHKLAVMLQQSGCLSLGRARIGEVRERLYACRRTAMYERLPPAKVRNLLIEQRERTSGAAADFGEVDEPGEPGEVDD